jgi:hypothetical protein
MVWRIYCHWRSRSRRGKNDHNVENVLIVEDVLIVENVLIVVFWFHIFCMFIYYILFLTFYSLFRNRYVLFLTFLYAIEVVDAFCCDALWFIIIYCDQVCFFSYINLCCIVLSCKVLSHIVWCSVGFADKLCFTQKSFGDDDYTVLLYIFTLFLLSVLQVLDNSTLLIYTNIIIIIYNLLLIICNLLLFFFFKLS